MGSDEKWYFTRQQLDNSPSRQCGIDSLKELSYRQQAANFIQDLGQRLKVSQLCMNTAIVYMHRFYVFHSFTHFPWSSIAAAALFLSAKVEEQPRKVEHVIKVAYLCKNHKEINFDANPEKFQVLSQDLVFNENILLQTLGFDVAIDHPHTHIVRCCHLVRAGKDLAQCAYFMASNSLHLTTMCLQYKPTVVACFCIHLACKWSRWEIPLSNEKKEWFSYIDPTVTLELLERLTEEFLITFEKCPSRLKEKIMSVGGSNMSSMIDQHNWSQNHHQQQQSNSPLETEKKPPESSEGKEAHHRPQGHVSHHHGDSKSNMHDETNKPRSSKSLNEQALSSGQPGVPLSLRDREKEYRDRKERERISGQHGSVKLPPPHPSSSSGKQPLPPHYHHKHRPPPLGSGPPPPGGRQEPRDILREASKQQARSGDKDVQKRDYVVKTNVTDVNSLSNFVPDARLKYSEKQRAEQAKGKVHDANVRRHESEAERQKHLHKSGYVSKSGVHPAQKVKPPYLPDTSKTMPKPYRPEVPHNGHSSLASSSNSSGGGGGGSVPSLTDDKYNMKQDVKEDAYVMPPVKKPSLFSPEKSPPHKKRVEMKTDFSPPNPITTSSYAPISVSQANKILKTDPEPRVNKKETLDNSEYPDIPSELNKLLVPDIITPIPEPRQKPPEPSISKELKPPDLIPPFQNTTNNLPTISNTLLQSQPLANGIETDPTLISNLLKETPTVPHLPAVAATVAAATPQSAAETKDKEHHHKERKKKNKEKHKHKDKDRNREEKEKKKKHKDKDKDKHKSKDKYHQQKEEEPAPIKITIQKDKIQLPHGEPAPMVGLKIKIPKDRIKAENISEAPAPPSSGGLKIKIPIPKEVVNNFSAETNGRKRERTSPLAGPTAKLPRTSSFKYNEPKQNGRHKVSGYTVAPNNNNGRPPMPHYNQPRPPQPHHYPHPPPPPPPPQQQHFYYYPTNMNIPPNMNMNMNMNMPPPTAYMYHHQQQYYPNPGFLYTPQHAVAVAAGGGGGGGQPPLPADAPPDVPPPPPPE